MPSKPSMGKRTFLKTKLTEKVTEKYTCFWDEKNAEANQD